MITKPTVLILGAGASMDYGFPSGIGLRNIVCHDLAPPAAEIIREAGFDTDEMREFADALRFSGYTSVDWFLEDRPNFIAIGKAAIAAALIPLEKPENLFPPQAPGTHWYELLVNTLDTPQGAFTKNRLSIVTFNYDRSLEYYLFRVLENRLGSEHLAIDALNSMDIIHVHGALGELAPLSGDGRSYSPTLQPKAILTAAKNIVVVGEASEETEAFKRAQHQLRAAERIVFLGFGFHSKSVERLAVFNELWDDDHRQRVRVGGTSRGIPDHTWQDICENRLNHAFHPGFGRGGRVFDFLYRSEPLNLEAL